MRVRASPRRLGRAYTRRGLRQTCQSERKNKKKTEAPTDALLVGEVPEVVDPGLAALLEDPISTGRASGLPKLHPRPAFLLRHWPMNWEVAEVDGAPTWLPCVDLHLLVRGAAGIRTPGPHEPESNAYADAVLEARRRGWVYLPLSGTIDAEHLPPGVPAGRYRRRIRGQHPITRVDVEAWVLAWEIPQPGLPGEPLSFELDRESYNRWRASLVTSGQIAPPVPQAKRAVLATITRHLGRARNSGVAPDVKAAQVEALTARLEAVNAAKVPS